MLSFIFLTLVSLTSLFWPFCMESFNISISAHMLAQWVAIKENRIMQFLQSHLKIQAGIGTIATQLLQFKIKPKSKLCFQISSEVVCFTIVKSVTDSFKMHSGIREVNLKGSCMYLLEALVHLFHFICNKDAKGQKKKKGNMIEFNVMCSQ